MKAAAGGHVMAMVTLLAHGADPNVRNPATGWTALTIATMLGHVDAVLPYPYHDLTSL